MIADLLYDSLIPRKEEKADLLQCASHDLCKELLKCKKIPIPCESEILACHLDMTCHAIAARKDTKECAANKLCRSANRCVVGPCWDKFAACDSNPACSALIPKPKASDADHVRCAAHPLCKELLKCQEVPIPCESETTACHNDATCDGIRYRR